MVSLLFYFKDVPSEKSNMMASKYLECLFKTMINDSSIRCNGP